MRKAKTISKILKLKDNRKREVEIEVRKASDRVDEEKSKLVNLEKDYHEKLSFFNEKNQEGSLSVQNISSYYDFFSRISSKIKEQRDVHAQRKNELNNLKITLVNAHKDKKVFEILKEKNLKKDLKEKAASEQNEADFLTLARRFR